MLGATGLLGNAIFRVLSKDCTKKVFGTIRNAQARQFFTQELKERLLIVGNLEKQDYLVALFDLVQPSVVVNCIALGKLAQQDPMSLVSVFSLLPHRLAHLCRYHGVCLVQISSDAVFSGKCGVYKEEDLPDAIDPYGIAKWLGEIDESGAVTLRISIIGPEIIPRNGLLEWFLSQDNECKCYTRVIYSGFPSAVLGQIMDVKILANVLLSFQKYSKSTELVRSFLTLLIMVE